MKKCTKCGELKNSEEFSKRSGYGNKLRSHCKLCLKLHKRSLRHTKEGLISNIYRKQLENSRKRNHPKPSYSRLEHKDWMLSQKVFHRLFDNWELSNYERDLVPSCDRLDSYKPYTFDNIRIVTWRKNDVQNKYDIKNGINNKHSKPVAQYDLGGIFIEKFHSTAEACRQTKTSLKIIMDCCKGRRHSSKYHIW